MSGGRREALLRALGAYRGDEPGDEEAVSRFRSFLARDDPFRREDPEGHVTASAVVARLGNVAGTGPAGLHPPQHFKFLVIFHRKLDRWLQPGGHVEDGDVSVFDAALRETREETGMSGFTTPIGDAILDLDVHPIPAFGSDPAHTHYDVRFLLTTEDGRAPAPDAAWYGVSEIGPNDPDGSLSRAVRKAIGRLRSR
jgi:8-oxo-dGTP pyrophosphatase MutT (NUDIX family)